MIVVTADRRVRALAARDLSPVGILGARGTAGRPPVGIGDGCFVMDRAGGVMAFGHDGQRTWSIKLGSEVVGAPADSGSIGLAAHAGRDAARPRAVRRQPNANDRRWASCRPVACSWRARMALVAAARGTIRPVDGPAGGREQALITLWKGR